MLVEVLLDTPIHVHYGYLSLGQSDDAADLDDAYRGQVNSLCGASAPGALFMKTGLHTGEIRVRIELHTDEPDLDDRWQDVVEVLYSTRSDDLVLAAFDSQEGPVDLPPGVYRARYCAHDFQQGRDLDTAAGGSGPDDYLLQFWPATGVDRVVRQDGQTHGPAPTWSADELAARVADLRQERGDREQEETEDELDDMWYGQPPDDPRLRAAGWGAAMLSAYDHPLLEALADADDDLRRAVTVWALELMLADADLLDQIGVAAALTAVREGTPRNRSWQLAQARPRLPMPPEVDLQAEAQMYAIEALDNAASGGDTLATVCDVLVAAFRNGPGAVRDLTRVRTAFPELA